MDGDAFRITAHFSRPTGGASVATQRRGPEVERPGPGRLSLRGDGYRGELDLEARTAELDQGPERFPIDAAIRAVLADRLGSDGGVLVHGVGLAVEGRGWLFTGPSGAGKSTLGGLASAGGARLLSDELVVVRNAADQVILEGTPWNVGFPERAPAVGLGLLGWGSAHRLEEVPASEVLRTLIANVALTDDSPEARARAFRTCSELVSRLRPARLVFALTPGVVEALR